MRVLAAAILLPLAAFAGEVFPLKPVKASDKEQVTLRGVVNVVTFPVGDEMALGKTQAGLVLFTPNDIECTGDAGEGPVKEIVRILHLAPSESAEKDLPKLQGKPVELTGKVFPAHTRHHRTAFLLSVDSVKELKD